jgi:hypothetical protein
MDDYSLETTQSDHAPHPGVVELREMLQCVLGDNFVRLYHFGSRIEGGAAPDSDYDVLCVTQRPLSREQRDEVLDRRMDLELARDIFFDLHFRQQEEIESGSAHYSPYVDHAISVGVVV